MQKPLISIIVPIFNTQVYLEQCFFSIANQTYENIEVLLINDGSTDESAEICQKYCQDDKRFRLIEQDNCGLGSAKNKGLDCAVGEYICFVDSDDYVDAQFVEILYENLNQNNADISMCSYIKFEDGMVPDTEKNRIGPCRTVVLDKEQLLSDIATVGAGNRSERVVVSWNKLMKKGLWDELRFPKKYHEDEFVIMDLILNSTKVVLTDDSLYFYRQRKNSIMGSGGLQHLDLLLAIRKRLPVLKNGEYRKVFSKMLIAYFENAVYLYFSLEEQFGRARMKKEIFPSYAILWFRYNWKMPIRKRIRYGLFMLSPERYQRHYQF